MTSEQRLEKLKACVTKARELSPLDEWEFKQIQDYILGLFTFAKFKTGDEVRMAKTYPVNAEESWGWMAYRHLLRENSSARVQSVDWFDGEFVYMVEFHENSWIDHQDQVHVCTSNHTYFQLRESWLKQTKQDGDK